MRAVRLSDVSYVGFDGDDTDTEKGFVGTHNQSQIAVPESVASDVFSVSLSYTLVFAPDRSNFNLLWRDFFSPSIKITHVNILETQIVHADSIY